MQMNDTAESEQGKRVLVVEDDDGIREPLKEYLDLSGYSVRAAASAEEALTVLAETSFEVIITDIILGGMDGLDLTSWVKEHLDADVIVMTGYSDDYFYEDVINKGASDLVFKPVRYRELLLRLKRVLKERQLNQDRIDMLKKVQKLAITDGLTRLFNSRHFYDQLDREVDRSNRYRHPLALLLLDIDNFKQYNDTYGHIEGDKVLVRIGKTIRSCLRTIDSAYRYGGEEFTVLLPETSGEEAVKVAERIRISLAECQFKPEKDASVQVTVSTGVTQHTAGETTSSFVRRADEAMYTSKKAGKNRVTYLSGRKREADS
jgi:two-component system cell cycle response regulator